MPDLVESVPPRRKKRPVEKTVLSSKVLSPPDARVIERGYKLSATAKEQLEIRVQLPPFRDEADTERLGWVHAFLKRFKK